MQTINKEKAKAAFDAIKKITSKANKKVIELSPLLKVTVSYDVVWDIYDGLYLEMNSEKSTPTEELKKLLQKLDVRVEDLLQDYNFDKEIDLKSDGNLIDKLIKESGVVVGWYGNHYNYNNFEQWWKVILEKEEKSKTIQSCTVVLNREYKAVVDKKNKVVKVGCQTISIDKVEQILKLYNS